MAGRVIIVGGGYVGTELAQALDTEADVTLIEPREAFVHSAAMIRAVVKPDLVEQALFPYDRLLARGTVLRARAASVSAQSVTLETGRVIEGDVIVVATGSSYAAPFKPTGDTVDSLRTSNAAAHAAVRDARHVAIVGAGAVGSELAGEIKAVSPATAVTLISDLASLFPTYPARLGTDLLKKLDLLGVEVILGQSAVGLERTDAPFSGPLTLTDGRQIDSDLVFPATGAIPQTHLLDPLPGVTHGADGRVLTDKWMRPSDHPNLFVAGDAADNGDGMTIVGASRQTPWLARIIRGVLSGKPAERMVGYMPWGRAPILLPLGEHLGSSFMPLVGLVGNGPTRLIKGRFLFLPKYGKLFKTTR